MRLTKIFTDIDKVNELEQYHVETALVTKEELAKQVLTVKTRQGNEYEIDLTNNNEHLKNGSTFLLGHDRLLVLILDSKEELTIEPKDSNEMGSIAYMLGEMHKVIEIKDEKIILASDPLVLSLLKQYNVEYVSQKVAVH